MLLPPQPDRSGKVGHCAATAFIVVETVLVHWFQEADQRNRSERAVFLLGVLVMPRLAISGTLALATTLVSAVVYFYFHLDHGGPIVAHDFLALLVFPPIADVSAGKPKCGPPNQRNAGRRPMLWHAWPGRWPRSRRLYAESQRWLRAEWLRRGDLSGSHSRIVPRIGRG